jgi:peroxiredoxin
MKNLLMILILLPFLCLGKVKENPKHIVKIGDTAPDFTLTYQDGKTQKLSDLRGKVIMLQFTASWCSVCMKEMPHIEKDIWQKYKNNNNFVLRGIDFKEDIAKIKKFEKAAKISYPILLDTSGAIFELYAEKDAGVTRNIIIDKNGKIAFLTRLYDKKEFNAMKEKIAKLLSDTKEIQK